MTSNKINKRRQLPSSNKEWDVDSPRSSRGLETIKETIEEHQHRVPFQEPENSPANEDQVLQQEQSTEVAGPTKKPMFVWPDIEPFTPAEQCAFEAEFKAMKEAERQRIEAAELPKGSDLDKSYVPHYRNSFPEYPPIPSDASKSSLLLREPQDGTLEELIPPALQLAESDDEWSSTPADILDYGTDNEVNWFPINDKRLFGNTEPMDLTDDEPKEKKAIPKTTKHPNIKLNVNQKRDNGGPFGEDNMTFPSFRLNLDQEENGPFRPLNISKRSDGSYNHDRNDNNFVDIREERAILGLPDYPVPDTDDMRIPPRLNTYRGYRSGRKMEMRTTDFWNWREERFKRVQKGKEAQKREEERKAEGKKKAGSKEMYGIIGGGLSERRAVRVREMGLTPQEKARIAHKQKGLCQNGFERREKVTSPKRKRE